jgi:hypothetical protein
MVLTGAGCSDLSVARTLDSRKVAHQISQDIGTSFTIASPTVRCPSGIKAEAGRTFDCTTALENQALTIHVTVNDTRGGFTPTLAQAVLPVSKIASAIKANPAPGTVACDHHTLLVKRPGDSFACTVTSGGATQTVNLTVQDLNGTVTYQPPSPDTTTTAPAAPPSSS